MSQRDLPTGTVTFLFTDIEGSTRLAQELGDGSFWLQWQARHGSLVNQFVAVEGQ